MLFLQSSRHITVFRRMCSSQATQIPKQFSYDTLIVTQPSNRPFVFHVEINRPEKRNAMNIQFWREIRECFEFLGKEANCRAIVLSAKGKMFTSGIDLSDLASMASIVTSDQDIARKCRALRETISNYQKSMSSLEKCSKPVICAIHDGCVGGGIDLVSASDIRYCSSDAWFQVKEVDVGLAADVGTLQRFPKIVGNESLVRELCLTARKFYSNEAFNAGFVSRVFPDKHSLITGALDIATLISEKSPVAVQATKEALIHARDHSVEEGLDYIATVNMALLQSEDVLKAVTAGFNKEKPVFAKL